MNICIFGDSVTFAGYIKNSWANLLKDALEKYSSEYVSFFNLGINGNTSIDILKRFSTESSARLPDIIVFAYGINDSCYISDPQDTLVSKKRFLHNTQLLIDQAKDFTKAIFFVGLVLGDEDMLKPYAESVSGRIYSRENAQIFDNHIKDLAEKNNCKHISLFNILTYDDFSDGLHPNEEGHKKMFKVIKEYF